MGRACNFYMDPKNKKNTCKTQANLTSFKIILHLGRSEWIRGRARLWRLFPSVPSPFEAYLMAFLSSLLPLELVPTSGN